ncbi:extracellular solute-binding protein [Palleronia caenipelagi]|uniref:ABC transporter substrate-binding protein n=1 Tax=Palleronia caenipelagi TaxID=2489174 RepID=A0A547Q5K5_9RHOB|nr:extracellular solute-binding protein [Palleronia caenipelagi]TRD21653.1 ABC transporter substrate-binding protein [Palleronia caenipelagi]
MTPARTTPAHAIVRQRPDLRPVWLAALGLGALLATGSAVKAQDADVTETHAYSNLAEPAYGPDIAHLDYVNPNASKGGRLSTSTSSVFDSFNPFTRKGVAEFTASSLMMETILRSTADDPYSVYCYLCTTMEYPEDIAWVIFNLRDDVTFSDGTPMTAEDLAFSVNLVLEQGIAEFRNTFSRYFDSVEVLDPHRIKFTFTEEAPIRDRISFAGGTSVFSQTDFETNGLRLDESQSRPFMGTGPYVLGEVDMGRSVTYTKNPDWWGAEHPLNVGRWNFDEIGIEVFADASAALEGFKAGEYTFRSENSSKEWATSYDFPALAKGWVIKTELPDGAIGQAQGFIFNLRRDKWQDVQVRQAIADVLNFEWSNDTLFYGLYDRPVSFWQNTDLMATGTPGEDEIALLQPLVDEGLLPEDILSEEAAVPQVNDPEGNTPSRRVLRAASASLEEAGWTFAEGAQFRSKDGQPLAMTILTTSPAFDRIVNPYVENLRLVGVDAKLERVDSSQYVERSRSADWDLITHSPTQEWEPSSTLRQWFHSSTAEDSSRNLMALQDPAVDRLVDNLIEANTLEDVTTGARALDRVLRSIHFWIPQWYKDVHTVAYWDMFRYPDPLPPLDPGVFDLWWYDAEAAERLKSEGAL